MIVCPKCRKPNEDHYKFCLGCGADMTPARAAPPMGMPMAMQPSAPTITPRMCPSCGANAPAPCATCMLCDAPLAGAQPLPPPVDGIHWIQVRVAFGCMQCNQRSPLGHLDVEGRFHCFACARDALFDPDIWAERLPLASALGDCFWASAGVFPPWPQYVPDEDAFEERGKPWSDIADDLSKALPIIMRVGQEKPRLSIEQTGMSMGANGMRTRSIDLKLAPGHPLCPQCRVPLAASGAGRGVATLRCNQCGGQETYQAPDKALAACEELMAVAAPEHVQGRGAVRVEAQAGTAAVAIKCPQCGSPIQLAPDARVATCTYCRTSALVPMGVLTQAFGAKPPAPRPFWIAMRAPSGVRHIVTQVAATPGAAQRGMPLVPDAFTGRDSDDDRVEREIERAERSANNANKIVGIIGGVIGGIGAIAGIVIAIVVNLHDDSTPPPVAPSKPKATAPAAAPTPPVFSDPGSEAMKSAFDGFLSDVRAKKYADAYGRMGPGYRKSVTLARFTAGVKANAYLRDAGSFSAIVTNRMDDTGSIEGTLRGDSGPIGAKVSLSRADGKWSITGLTLGGNPALPAP